MDNRNRRRDSWLALCALVLAAPGLSAAPAVTARDRVEALLQSLADAPGPSGYEEEVRSIMVRELKPFTTHLRYDGLGSVIADQGASGPRIMLDAHMDELGGIVRRITPEGFLSMQMVGGWLDQALVGQRWVILGSKGAVHAVTGIRDIHVLPSEDRTKVFPRDGIFLDVGARSAEEVAALGIEPGDPVAPDSPFTVLNGTQRYLGKAWDDRVGCAVVLEVMRRLAAENHPNTVVAAATTQEETGLRGAHTAADVVHPDIGIAIEGGVAGDVPGARPEETQARLGAGPGVFLYDFDEQPNRRLVGLVKETAKAAKIPLQFDLVSGYGDDSSAIQASNGGVPTVNIVVPVRYTHAHNGIMDRGDFDRTVDLVVALIKRLDAGAVKRLRDFGP
jgi:putative aminopeptidase FrvX